MPKGEVCGVALCSGAGGLELGLSSAIPGYRTVCHVEREATSAAVLVSHMARGFVAQAPIWSDIRTFDGIPWSGRVHIVSGGIPCQPFSVAGKRRGTEDERHLWPHALRIIREVGPEFVFIENVGGSVRDLGEGLVRPDLEQLGYRTAAGIFTAQEVGAPHRRERLFVLGVAHAGRRSDGQQLWETSAARGSGQLADAGHRAGSTEHGQQQEEQSARSGQRGASVVNTAGERLQGRHGRELGSNKWLSWPPGPTDSDAWSSVLAARPDLAPATAQPGLRDVADGLAGGLAGLSRSDRLRILGNGVVPAQAAHAFRTLMMQFLKVPADA